MADYKEQWDALVKKAGLTKEKANVAGMSQIDRGLTDFTDILNRYEAAKAAGTKPKPEFDALEVALTTFKQGLNAFSKALEQMGKDLKKEKWQNLYQFLFDLKNTADDLLARMKKMER